MTGFRFDPGQHQYFFGDRRVVGITEAISRAGLKPPMSEFARRNFELAGTRGSIVHRMCELHDTGEADLYDMDPNLQGYVDAWKSFCQDYAYEPEVVELPMGHPIFAFGGTPDTTGWCGKLDGYAVAERKSVPYQTWMKYQLAGQRLLVEEATGRKVKYELVVSLAGNGLYSVRACADPKARGVFLAAVTVANAQIGAGL